MVPQETPGLTPMSFRKLIANLKTYLAARRDRRLMDAMSWRDLTDIGVEALC